MNLAVNEATKPTGGNGGATPLRGNPPPLLNKYMSEMKPYRMTWSVYGLIRVHG